MAYLGYINSPEENQLSAVQVTRQKQIDLQKRQTSRNVFHCHVIGPQGAGKTSFMQGFLGKTLEEQVGINKAHLSPYTVNSVQVYGQEKYLIVRLLNLIFNLTQF